jgi:hypothetical protein
VDISINIGDKLGVFFGGLMVGFLDQNTLNYLGPKGPRQGGKQDVPDTDVGDISGVNRFQSGPKSEVKE